MFFISNILSLQIGKQRLEKWNDFNKIEASQLVYDYKQNCKLILIVYYSSLAFVCKYYFPYNVFEFA